MPVKLHELEDMSWFPHFLREMQMDFIGSMVLFLDVYKPIIPEIQNTLAKSNSNQILDLCSGSGEPMISISSQLNELKMFYLSDLYPNRKNEAGDIRHWVNQPFNALDNALEIHGVRTIFNAYHHFDEEAKSRLLMNHAPHGLFIAEVLQPNLFTLFKIVVTTTLGQLIFCPFIKPFSWKRILFTYVIPINLFTITWDGIISVLKSQSLSFMKFNARKTLGNEFDIQVGLSGPFYARVSWLSITKKG